MASEQRRDNPVPPEGKELGAWPSASDVAGDIYDDPLRGSKWLETLYQAFVCSPPTDDIREPHFPIVVQSRGGEQVAFTEPVYCGVSADGRFVQVVVDDTGFHRLVRIVGPGGYQEPSVYDGSHRSAPGGMRVDFVRADNPLPWMQQLQYGGSPAGIELRDSVVVTTDESGDRCCVIHDGKTGRDIPVYPVDMMRREIAICGADNVIQFPVRSSNGLGGVAVNF